MNFTNWLIGQILVIGKLIGSIKPGLIFSKNLNHCSPSPMYYELRCGFIVEVLLLYSCQEALECWSQIWDCGMLWVNKKPKRLLTSIKKTFYRFFQFSVYWGPSIYLHVVHNDKDQMLLTSEDSYIFLMTVKLIWQWNLTVKTKFQYIPLIEMLVHVHVFYTIFSYCQFGCMWYKNK